MIRKFFAFKHTEEHRDAAIATFTFLTKMRFPAKSPILKELAEKIKIENSAEKGIFEVGLFRESHLAMYLNEHPSDVRKSVPVGFIEHAIERLVHFGVIQKIRAPGLPWMAYQVLDLHLPVKYNRLISIIYGMEHVLADTKNNTFKICVRGDGDEFSGTGFFSTYDSNGKTYGLIVTNKHVVDPSKWEITEISNSRANLAIGGIVDVKLHPSEDVAIIILGEGFNPVAGLYIWEEPISDLSDIITVGYPNIGYTRSSTPLVHKGEVNGVVELYNGSTRLIISADVAPGNSGCPVLNELGCVVGIVTEDLETRTNTGTDGQDQYPKSNVHHSAILASSISQFISGIFD